MTAAEALNHVWFSKNLSDSTGNDEIILDESTVAQVKKIKWETDSQKEQQAS